MKKLIQIFIVVGLVGLMCGCELETTALSESDISDNYNEEVKKSLRKLMLTGNCRECPFVGVDISGKDLSHKDLTKAPGSGKPDKGKPGSGNLDWGKPGRCKT